MKIIKTKNYDEMSKAAANIIAAQITLKPNSVMGFATGSTPIGTYAELIKKNQNGDIDFSNIKTILTFQMEMHKMQMQNVQDTKR